MDFRRMLDEISSASRLVALLLFAFACLVLACLMYLATRGDHDLLRALTDWVDRQ